METFDPLKYSYPSRRNAVYARRATVTVQRGHDFSTASVYSHHFVTVVFG